MSDGHEQFLVHNRIDCGADNRDDNNGLQHVKPNAFDVQSPEKRDNDQITPR